MKNHEFQELVDQNLSGLVWDERKRQKVLHAISEEEKPVKKISTTFILVAAILCISVTALAAGLIFSPRYDAVRIANQTMEEKYGITADLLSLFYREVKENGDGTSTVTFSIPDTASFPTDRIGEYSVTVSGNKGTASWSKDGMNTSGSLSRPLAHNITCVAFGLFWAGAGIAAPLLADATVFALEPAQTGAAVFIGFLLAQAVVLSETMKSGSVFMPNVKFNFIYAGVIGALIAFVAVAMLTPLGQAFGITVLPVAGWLCALIPPAVLLLVYEIYKVLYAVYLSARRWKEKREM